MTACLSIKKPASATVTKQSGAGFNSSSTTKDYHDEEFTS